MITKQCTKCENTKPISDFYSKKSGKHGVATWCIVCTNIYMRKRHSKPEVKQKQSERSRLLYSTSDQFRSENKLRSKKFYQSANGRARTLLNNARKAPISKIFPCTVDLSQIVKQIELGVCPVTGIQFQLSNESETKKNAYSPSIDRINSSEGYTNENTRIVIWQYNLMKGELSDLEVLQICKRILERAT